MKHTEIQHVLDFWFSAVELESPRVDSRMDRWFGNDAKFDRQVGKEFGELVEMASDGKLTDWEKSPEGRLALIILIDQFRRNIYRGSADAFAKDDMALKICVEGTKEESYKELTPIQCLFFFMPMQHAESLKIQKKSIEIYQALAESVTATMRETFMTTTDFAQLHHDIVAEYGRFPHRNEIMGRPNTAAEAAYLVNDGPTFGQ